MTLVFFLVSSIILDPVYYTNSNYFYEITGKDSFVFGATNGGLVRYNMLRNTFDVITSTDGLLCNRTTSCSLDSAGYVWAGCDLGLAVVNSDLATVANYPSQYISSVSIHDIVAVDIQEGPQVVDLMVQAQHLKRFRIIGTGERGCRYSPARLGLAAVTGSLERLNDQVRWCPAAIDHVARNGRRSDRRRLQHHDERLC